MRNRNRVSYPQEMRDRSSSEGKGLFTVHVQYEGGPRIEIQGLTEDAKIEALLEQVKAIFYAEEQAE